MKCEYTFLLLNFLITDFYNSSANYFVLNISIFNSATKNFRELKQVHVDIHHILDR